MFFWNSCFFDDPADVGNLISGSSAFSKTSLNIWKFTAHVLLKTGLENFEITLLACEGGCQEEVPHVQGEAAAWAQEGREELLHLQGQEWRL